MIGNKSINLKAILTAEDKSGGAFSSFHGGLDTTAKKSGMASVALKGLAIGAIAGVGYAFKDAIQQAVEFDASMRNVNSIAKLSEDEFKNVSKSVLDMTETIPQSANQLSKSLYDVYSSGFQGELAMKVLEVSAKGASAGLTDTATSGRALMGVMNAYNMKTGPDAEHIMDVLFKTVDRGVITFEELAQNIGDVISMSSAVGVPIETVGAAFATMTKKGIQASEAGTSIMRLLQSFLKPSENMADALKKLGYQSGLTAMQSDGLNGVLQKLWEQSGHNIEKFNDLFTEIRAAKGAMVLASDGSAMFTEDLKAMGEASGATKIALDEQSKSTEFQYQLLKNKLNKAMIEAGTLALPVLNKGIDLAGKGFWGLSDALHGVFVDLGVVKDEAVKTAPTMAGSADIVTLAYQRQEKATDNVRLAMERLKQSEQIKKLANDSLKVSTDTVAQAQERVNTAIQQFGPQSEQAKLAGEQLKLAQYGLETQMQNQFKAVVNVANAKGFLKTKNDELSGATQSLVNLQGFLNNSNGMLRGSLQLLGLAVEGPIAKFNQLQGAIQLAIDKTFSFQGQVVSLQQNVAHASSLVETYGGLTDKYRGLQGGGGTARVKQPWEYAVGGFVMAGRSHIVGEKGPELFVPSQSGRIIPNNELGGGSSVTVNFYGNLNNSKDMDVDEAGSRIARQIQLAMKGAS